MYKAVACENEICNTEILYTSFHFNSAVQLSPTVQRAC